MQRRRYLKIEMHFLPDVYVPCEVCHGKRYNRETLEVKYKGKNIYDVLNMTVEEALEFFDHVPSIKRKIQTLYDVDFLILNWGSLPQSFPEERHSVSSWLQNLVKEARERPSISWMNPLQDCILQMCINLLKSSTDWQKGGIRW